MRSTIRLPKDYTKSFVIDLQKDRKKALLVNGIALLIGAAVAGMGLVAVPIQTLFDMRDGIWVYLLRFLVLLVGLIAYIVLHEVVHGIFMRHFSGVKPHYGFTGMYAYAGSDAYFDKQSYIIIALAPIVIWGIVLGVLCAVVSPVWFWPVYFIQIANLSGAAGDLYVTVLFSRLPDDILIQDSGVSMTVYQKNS